MSAFLRRHAVALVASLLVTAGVAYTVRYGGFKLVPEAGDFGRLRWWTVGAYVPLWFAMTWFRSVRWRFLLHELTEMPRRRLFAISCVGFAAILLLPLRAGEFVRPYLVRTPRDARGADRPALTMTAATSSILAERVIDGVFLGVVLALVLVLVPTLEPLPDRVPGLPISVASVRASGFIMLGIFVIALTAIAVFYFARAWARRATEVVIGAVSPKLADKLASFAEQAAGGLHVFGRARAALAFLAETAAYWGLNAIGMWVLAYGCGVVHADGSSITVLESCGLMGMLGCALLIPGPPGLLGVFQAGVYAGMAMYFAATTVGGAGAAFAFLLYMSQLVLHVASGSWGLWVLGGARRLRGALANAEERA